MDLSRIEENFCVHADAIIKVFKMETLAVWAPDEMLALSMTPEIYIYARFEESIQHTQNQNQLSTVLLRGGFLESIANPINSGIRFKAVYNKITQ